MWQIAGKQTCKLMDLHVLVSRKGTRVVTASNLYRVLELPPAQYGTRVRRWVRDVYELEGELRRPEHGRDFAPRKVSENPAGDYYLSLPLALQIVLRSNSRHKVKYARHLKALCASTQPEVQPHPEVARARTGLARTLALVSCQIACEQHHLEVYRRRNRDSAAGWWPYRAQLLGYTLEELRRRAAQRGIDLRRKSARALLLLLDEAELVRAAAIDLFMALGYEAAYALALGEAVRAAFEAGGWSVCDDRAGGNIFSAAVPERWIHEVCTLEAGELLTPFLLPVPATPARPRAEPAREAV